MSWKTRLYGIVNLLFQRDKKTEAKMNNISHKTDDVIERHNLSEKQRNDLKNFTEQLNNLPDDVLSGF